MSTPEFRKPEQVESTAHITYSPEVQALIDGYDALNEEQFRDALADAVFAGSASQLEALHSDHLIERTYYAAQHLVNQVNNELNKRERVAPDVLHRRRMFRDAMGTERRRAQAYLENLRARQGRLSNARNPTQRALIRLAKENPVRFIALKREEQALEREAKARAKEEARARRRAARARAQQ